MFFSRLFVGLYVKHVKNAGEIILNGTGTSTFPNLLEWSDVESICSSYGADALIVLSTFDSDSRIFEGKSVVRTKTVKGPKIKEVEYPVTLIMEIESGWRIYDLTTKEIVDVSTFTEERNFILKDQVMKTQEQVFHQKDLH